MRRLYVTVMVAALDVDEPAALVNRARNCQPFTNGMTVPLKLGEVNPATSVHVEPWLTDSCHCTVGLGLPVAADERVTTCPDMTV